MRSDSMGISQSLNASAVDWTQLARGHTHGNQQSQILQQTWPSGNRPFSLPHRDNRVIKQPNSEATVDRGAGSAIFDRSTRIVAPCLCALPSEMIEPSRWEEKERFNVARIFDHQVVQCCGTSTLFATPFARKKGSFEHVEKGSLP